MLWGIANVTAKLLSGKHYIIIKLHKARTPKQSNVKDHTERSFYNSIFLAFDYWVDVYFNYRKIKLLWFIPCASTIKLVDFFDLI